MITLVAYERSNDLPASLWSSCITFVCGLLLVVRGRPDPVQLRPRDMYLLTTGSWVVACTFTALPMVFISGISFTDAFFETMSGITTTGSTVLSGLDSTSPGLLIWRSMLHWLGGIGFIGMAVAIFPLLRSGQPPHVLDLNWQILDFGLFTGALDAASNTLGSCGHHDSG